MAGETDTRSAAERIDAIIDGIGDWRADALRWARERIRAADPDVVEEIKWVKPTNPDGVATWTHDGIICTGEIYKDKVKLTFAQGASIDDPTGLFNASLGGGTRRAIDIHEDDSLDPGAFEELIRDAVGHNGAKKR